MLKSVIKLPFRVLRRLLGKKKEDPKPPPRKPEKAPPKWMQQEAEVGVVGLEIVDHVTAVLDVGRAV